MFKFQLHFKLKLPSLSTPIIPIKSWCQLEADIYLIDSFSVAHRMAGSETVTSSNLLRFLDDKQRSSSRTSREETTAAGVSWVWHHVLFHLRFTEPDVIRRWSLEGKKNFLWNWGEDFSKVCYFYQHLLGTAELFPETTSDPFAPCALILPWDWEGK